MRRKILFNKLIRTFFSPSFFLIKFADHFHTCQIVQTKDEKQSIGINFRV